MGILDRFKDQAQNKAEDLIESVGDQVDEKTGAKFAGQVDQAQDKAKEALGIDTSGQRPAEQPPSAEQPDEEQPPA